MIQDDFAWTFATGDTATLNYVRDEYLPSLNADIEAMQAIVDRCLTCNRNGLVIDAAMVLQEMIGRQKQQVDVAESRLRRALRAGVRHEQPPKLAVVIEGGLVQAVVTNHPDRFNPNLEVQIIDYDTDDADDDDLLLVPQGDGSYSEACGHVESIAEAAIDIDRIEPKAND